MHEASLIVEILKSVEETARKHGLTAVREVRMKIGELRQIEPESFRFIFDTLKRESPFASEAELKVEYIPITMLCGGCDETIIIEDTSFTCPHCGSEELGLVRGKEFLLESIEGD